MFELAEMWGMDMGMLGALFEGGMIVWDETSARYRLADGITLDEARKAARVLMSLADPLRGRIPRRRR